jgi:two-component system response regulator RegA
METRGFKVTTAQSVAAGLAQIKLSAPAYVVVDMRLADGCGLDVVLRRVPSRPLQPFTKA